MLDEKMGVCIEQRRLEHIEESHEILREDIKEIRDGFTNLTEEIHKMGLDLRGFAALVQGMLTRFDDRDKQLVDINVNNKEAFQRLGAKIDALEERVRLTEADRSNISVIRTEVELVQKVLWYLVGGIGALVLFYVQQRMQIP